MFGFRNPADRGGKSVSSLNFGFGISLDPSIKTLGDGFKDNQAPPPGETAVRYRTRSQIGLMIMTSYGF